MQHLVSSDSVSRDSQLADKRRKQRPAKLCVFAEHLEEQQKITGASDNYIRQKPRPAACASTTPQTALAAQPIALPSTQPHLASPKLKHTGQRTVNPLTYRQRRQARVARDLHFLMTGRLRMPAEEPACHQAARRSAHTPTPVCAARASADVLSPADGSGASTSKAARRGAHTPTPVCAARASAGVLSPADGMAAASGLDGAATGKRRRAVLLRARTISCTCHLS